MPVYFAYGSNLLSTRLTARCASARVLGVAQLAGHALSFAKYSWIDGSGKATIRAADAVCHGVAYEISAADLDLLDAIEGVGKGYDRLDDVAITLPRPSATQGDALQTLAAHVYIASDPREGQRPFDWYLALIVAGGMEHGLPSDLIDALRAIPHATDADTARPGHVAAVAALGAAGHTDWRALLGQDGGDNNSSS